MTAFVVVLIVVGVLIAIGLLVNVYLYSQGAFKRRRARRAQRVQAKRVPTAALDEQYYNSIGIGPTEKPTE